MELNDKELEALANVRVKKHKDIMWNRRYTIPMCVLIVIAFMSAFAIRTTIEDKVLVNSFGDKVVLVSGETMIIDGIVYRVDKEKQWEDYISYVGLGALLLAGLIYYKWLNNLKRPYIARFKEYYAEHRELME